MQMLSFLRNLSTASCNFSSCAFLKSIGSCESIFVSNTHCVSMYYTQPGSVVCPPLDWSTLMHTFLVGFCLLRWRNTLWLFPVQRRHIDLSVIHAAFSHLLSKLADSFSAIFTAPAAFGVWSNSANVSELIARF